MYIEFIRRNPRKGRAFGLSKERKGSFESRRGAAAHDGLARDSAVEPQGRSSKRRVGVEGFRV